MATRTIKVFSSKSGNIKSYETDVTTWGALRELIQGDYDLANIKAAESVGKTSLEHIDAALPETDFTLFLRPAETKSGLDFSEMSFKELREYIKTDESAKNFLNSYVPGKNFTQLSTSDLRAGLNLYAGSSQETTEVVEEVKKEKTPLDRLEKIVKKVLEVRDILEEEDLDLFEDELEYAFDQAETHLRDIIHILKNQTSTESVGQKSSEYEDLRKQANDIFDGFLS